MKKSTLVLISLLSVNGVFAQKKDAKFQKLPSGIEYNIERNNTKTPNAKLGDYISMHISYKVGDSTFFDSKKFNNGNPVEIPISNPQFKGDVAEGFTMLSEGDLAHFKISVDSILKLGNPPAEWMKPGENQTIDYTIDVVKVVSAEAKKAEMEKAAAAQISKDDAIIQEYLKKNNIKATKTSSGLYYAITKEGTGEHPKNGNEVTVNYTGKTTDGNLFDSNVEPQFNHVEPFKFTLGQGMVIRGWDEGIALLKKGSKATLFIPSGLAYGDRSPSPAIPANSVLLFDVELVDFAAKNIPSGHSEHDGHNH